MNWFDNNPLGKALAWAGGALGFVALLLSWAWSWPVSSGADTGAVEAPELTIATADPLRLGPLNQYQVVNERPLFNASRSPSATLDGGGELIDMEDVAAADMPSVRLTGVVITPDSRFATLSPGEGGKPVVAREGVALDGDFVGWRVSRIEPRSVRMESTDGASMNLDLAVHDEEIAEPPKPAPPDSAQADEGGEGVEDEEPLTRAEEIRRRIEERREQLRREAELEAEDADNDQESMRRGYQRTIQEMLQRSKNNDSENDNSDTDNGD